MGTTQPDASQRRRRRLGIVALAASVALGGSGATGGELGIYEWPSYSVPELAPGYAEKYGAAPRFEKLEDEQAAFERVRDGLQVDLAHPCARSLFLWRDAGLLEPIDPSRIERWDELDARFRDLPGFLKDG